MDIFDRLKKKIQGEPEAAPAVAMEPAPIENEVSEKKKSRRKPQDRSKLTRNKVVQIRMTEEEVAKLKAAAAAAGMSMADYIMAGIDQSRIVKVPGAANIRKNLFRSGYNLNQAVKLGNIAKREGQPVDMDSIMEAIGKLNEVFGRLDGFLLKWDAHVEEELKKEGE